LIIKEESEVLSQTSSRDPLASRDGRIAKVFTPPERRGCNSKLHDPAHNAKMRFLHSLLPSILLVGASVVQAASLWSFDEAVISVNSKGGPAFKDKYVQEDHHSATNIY
jgi:hypothetical protein